LAESNLSESEKAAQLGIFRMWFELESEAVRRSGGNDPARSGSPPKPALSDAERTKKEQGEIRRMYDRFVRGEPGEEK